MQATLQEVIPSLEEIKEAVWSCDSHKAPGYAGYNLNFIKKLWHVVGANFSNFIMNFFESGVFLAEINMT